MVASDLLCYEGNTQDKHQNNTGVRQNHVINESLPAMNSVTIVTHASWSVSPSCTLEDGRVYSTTLFALKPHGPPFKALCSKGSDRKRSEPPRFRRLVL